jgi:anti-sigma B factor antagonist
VNGREQGHGPDDDLMPVRSRRVGTTVVVAVSGEADIQTAPRLLPAVEQCLEDRDCRMLVVDLSGVDFLASAGLGALVQVGEIASGKGLPFRLVVGTNRHVTRPLELSGLDQVFEVFANVEQALDGTAANS